MNKQAMNKQALVDYLIDYYNDCHIPFGHAGMCKTLLQISYDDKLKHLHDLAIDLRIFIEKTITHSYAINKFAYAYLPSVLGYENVRDTDCKEAIRLLFIKHWLYNGTIEQLFEYEFKSKVQEELLKIERTHAIMYRQPLSFMKNL